MYSMVATVSNTTLHISKVLSKKVGLKSSHHKKKKEKSCVIVYGNGC